MKTFFDGLDQDIRDNLRLQLSVYWTYSSNALEGSSLTIGETDFVLREGITLGGKPLKDYKDAEGHFHAIRLMQNFLSVPVLTEEHLFSLHKLVIPDNQTDIYAPRGAWKNEYNGTYVYDDSGKSSWVSYPAPTEIPELMKRWLKMYNESLLPTDQDSAIRLYSRLHTLFAAIHPFFDGNGRMARLIANIPLQKAGFPPIAIPPEKRHEYISILFKSTHDPSILEDFSKFRSPDFESFLKDCWKKVYQMVEDAEKIQRERNLKLHSPLE